MYSTFVYKVGKYAERRARIERLVESRSANNSRMLADTSFVITRYSIIFYAIISYSNKSFIQE